MTHARSSIWPKLAETCNPYFPAWRVGNVPVCINNLAHTPLAGNQPWEVRVLTKYHSARRFARFKFMLVWRGDRAKKSCTACSAANDDGNVELDLHSVRDRRRWVTT